MSYKGHVCGMAALAILLATGPIAAQVEIDSNTFGGLTARSIGPAAMGGRIASLDAHEVDGKLTVYIGAATGGVWKSTNAGTTFKPIFDDYTQSIGAIEIDRANPDTVWVGTGEAWPRNSVSIGEGLYRTTDGGKSWERIGLEDSERIVEILIHPDDSDTVFVCVTGHLWDAHPDRGVYRTKDGGETWEAVLQIDENTGCGDIDMDAQEPDILYAAMWQFRREPWFFTSGGPGSGLYKSTDGGDTWNELTEGLPEGEKGRIAVASAPSRPSVVYATVESESTALYVSEDLGESWSRVGGGAAVEARPFYFSLLLVDPTNHKQIYKPAQSLGASKDGGETFDMIGGDTHSDHHALWIDPNNPNRLFLGTDGGLYISHDKGVTFAFRQALPLSQFYQVSYDMERPYNVYGGLQDNGTWYGPSTHFTGVQNKHWKNIGSGDGFHAYVDREDPDIVYVEWQGGRMQRTRKSTGETKDLQPLPAEGDPKYRFNWNAAMHLSPNRGDTIYLGAQFLFRSRDRGDSWEKISPDLTTNDPAKQNQIESGGLTPDNSTAENHCSIYRIAEAPGEGDTIWVGTDDGNLQVTRDGGASWTNVVDNVPDLPANTWVTGIDPSPHGDGVAFAVFDGHRTGDRTPYVYRTDDYGASWTSLVTEDVEGYALAIRQDPVNPDLVFLGTEFGLYITVDGGQSWARFKGDLPRVGVRDLQIHPREQDLIIATHGRGIFILDDITPLRHLTNDVLESNASLLPGRPTEMVIPASSQEFNGSDKFVGRPRSAGAEISYYMKKRHMFGDLRVEIEDADGNHVAKLPATKRRGVNRVTWSMRSRAPKVPPSSSLVPQFFSFLGPRVPAGEYKVKLIKGKDTIEGSLTLVVDPRAGYSAEEMALQDRTVRELYVMVERLTFIVDRVIDLRDQAKARIEALDDGDALADELQGFVDELEAFRKTLVATRKGGFIAGEEQLREKLTALYGSVNSYEGRPSGTQLDYKKVMAGQIDAADGKLAALVDDNLDDLGKELEKQKLDPLRDMTQEEWEAKRDG